MSGCDPLPGTWGFLGFCNFVLKTLRIKIVSSTYHFGAKGGEVEVGYPFRCIAPVGRRLLQTRSRRFPRRD